MAPTIFMIFISMQAAISRFQIDRKKYRAKIGHPEPILLVYYSVYKLIKQL